VPCFHLHVHVYLGVCWMFSQLPSMYGGRVCQRRLLIKHSVNSSLMYFTLTSCKNICIQIWNPHVRIRFKILILVYLTITLLTCESKQKIWNRYHAMSGSAVRFASRKQNKNSLWAFLLVNLERQVAQVGAKIAPISFF
jgi:hypothetical protein